MTVVLAAVLLVLAPTSLDLPPEIDVSATAEAPATRGTAVQVTETAPPPAAPPAGYSSDSDNGRCIGAEDLLRYYSPGWDVARMSRVMFRESRCVAEVRNKRSGSTGLLQLMPLHCRWLDDELGSCSVQLLQDPAYNIRAACGVVGTRRVPAMAAVNGRVPVRMTFVGGHLDVDVAEDELARWTRVIDDEHDGMMPGHLLQLTAMKRRRDIEPVLPVIGVAVSPRLFERLPRRSPDDVKERFYAIRLASHDLIYGEFQWMECIGPDDWTVAEESEHDTSTEYEIVEMVVHPIAKRSFGEEWDYGDAVVSTPDEVDTLNTLNTVLRVDEADEEQP